MLGRPDRWRWAVHAGVAARVDSAGRLRTLSDIAVPRRFADLFTAIPEHRFRVDTSSSELRARGRTLGG